MESVAEPMSRARRNAATRASRRPGRERTALALGGVTLVFMLAAIPIGIVAPARFTGNLGVILLMTPFAAVGVTVAYRQPRNSIGWILIAMALGTTLGLEAATYSLLRYRGHYHLPLGRLATSLSVSWVPVLVLLPLPFLLFPDGRIPAGRWRWSFWSYCALVVAFVAGISFVDLRTFTVHRVVVDSTGELNQLNVPAHGLSAVLNDLAALSYGVIFVIMIAYQVVRYRQSTGDARQQEKWLLAGGSVAIAGVLSASVFDPLSPLFLAVIALPLAIGIGILKYRLYSIDRLISRTISYTLLTAMLVAVFVGVIVLGTDVLPLSSPVAVAASTLAAAALFNPLRKRTQHLIDRRFNRARYDAQTTVAAFSGRLRNALDPDGIGGELLTTVEQTVAPAHASLWINNR